MLIGNSNFQDYKIGVFGSPVTLLFLSFSQRPSFFRTSIRSYRFKTFRFRAPLLDFPKLLCLDIVEYPYLIFGMNTLPAKSPSTAFACSLNPLGRLSFLDPVFLAESVGLLGDTARLFDCLLILVIDFLLILYINHNSAGCLDQ